MGFRSLLYWIDRAFAGDKRPLRFLAAWLAIVSLALLYLLTH